MYDLLQDMVHIADTKVTKRFGDYFIRHIQKVFYLFILSYLHFHFYFKVCKITSGYKYV